MATIIKPTSIKSSMTAKTTTTTNAETQQMEETTIKSNLNSVSNGCDFSTTFKRHLTTCLQRWRQKHPSSKAKSSKNNAELNLSEHQQQQNEEEESYRQCSCQHSTRGDKWFKKYTRKEFFAFHSHCGLTSSAVGSSFMQRTTVYCRTLNAKLYKILIPKELRRRSTTSTAATTTSTIDATGEVEEGPHQRNNCNNSSDCKVEIVAKLLSSTLVRTSNISTSTSNISRYLAAEQENFYSQRRRNSADSAYHSVEESFEIFQSSITSSRTTLVGNDVDDDMVVSELTFLEIRDEYPDLDSEIRSILTARAQDGATISDIRDDYRKLTGLTFPIYESVTEFLLTIPYVSAYCNENGTRIFNIRPMEKTKHIHNMVMEQKPQQESNTGHKATTTTINHRRYREHQRNTNYYPNNYKRHNQQQHHYQQHQQQQPHQHHFYEPLQPKSGPQQMVPFSNQMTSQNAVVTDNLMLKSANTDKIAVQQDNSEGFVEDNWIYNDNCNYLLNRIHSQEPVPTIYTNQMMIPSNDIYTADDPHYNQQQQNLQQFINAVPAAGQNNCNIHPNIVMPPLSSSCENNINYLNNLFQNHELPTNIVNTNNNNNNNIANVGGGDALTTNPRRSSYGTQKSLMPRSSRSSSPTAKSCYTNDSMYTDSDYEAHLLDFLLLGDDFFLYMARMELRCKFKKRQKVLQSGLCVSGQTISAAIKRVLNLNDNGRSIIVNIGSVNIMQGRQLIQIQHEYRELLTIMLKKGIRPILTTLAPLANYTHDGEMKRTLERFNQFVKREGERNNLIVIDIWKCLVNEKGCARFDCYQSEPRNVTGAAEPYLFWNNIGRQRVLQLIESQLEY